MERHLFRHPALVKPDEVFDYYEISESDLQDETYQKENGQKAA
ncbi:hypothetical protein CNEO3_1150003 [Clostridium neonatale]|nr:hypothetical protein CNEO3_1150003 [Clostridium neonatale]CAI3641004.1 hypothetical protein CNEO3_70112 [Clostridium neonatale]